MNYQHRINTFINKRKGVLKKGLFHKEIGYIDIVWGKNGEDGYGLAHIIEKHPEVVPNLFLIVKESIVIEYLKDRIILLYKENIKSIISLTWNDSQQKWLITTYTKIN